jgi:hypothetical protein
VHDPNPTSVPQGGEAATAVKHLYVLIALLLAAAAVSACSSRNTSSRIAQTEAMLTEAGFQPVQLSSPDQVEVAKSLPTYEMHYYDTGNGPVFWYYDPDECGCVYVGGTGDYDRFEDAQKQEHDISEYAAETQDEQVASLYVLNPVMFPPPLFIGTGYPYGWYGWSPGAVGSIGTVGRGRGSIVGTAPGLASNGGAPHGGFGWGGGHGFGGMGGGHGGGGHGR